MRWVKKAHAGCFLFFVISFFPLGLTPHPLQACMRFASEDAYLRKSNFACDIRIGKICRCFSKNMVLPFVGSSFFHISSTRRLDFRFSGEVW